jgi:hypothetical protein
MAVVATKILWQQLICRLRKVANRRKQLQLNLILFSSGINDCELIGN